MASKRLSWVVTLGVLLVPGLALAGSIRGTVRDGGTLLPISGIDLDVLDDRFRAVTTSGDSTLADGTYTLGPLDEGLYFVRVDPSLVQGYVDQYHPGVFLPSQAIPISVPKTGEVLGIDFELSSGTTISGIVIDAGTQAPLASIDLDVYGSDLSLLTGIDAVTAADGSYVLGAFPNGSFFVQADADFDLGQFYVDQFHPNADDLAAASPVVVTNLGAVTNVNFALLPGGTISGRITDSATGLPVDEIDIDVFGVGLQEVLYVDAATGADGTYAIGALHPGTYYVLADPVPGQPYVNTYFGQVASITTATPVVVSAGIASTSVDVVLTPLGFIQGEIRHATTGNLLAGIDLDVLEAATSTTIPGLDATTAVDGRYVIGPVPPGSYLVRADPTLAQGLVDQYHPGVFLRSEAVAITVAEQVVAGIDFQLSPGGTISGRVTASDTGLDLAGIDLDVMSFGLEGISSVDADTDVSGAFTLGALPSGTYYVRADPLPQQGYAVQYHAGATDVAGATLVTVTGTGNTPGVDFVLEPLGPVDVGESIAGELAPWTLSAPYPNPFSQRTFLRVAPGQVEALDLAIFDIRGRRVKRLPLSQQPQDAPLLLQWDGRDDSGNVLATGTYFVRLATSAGVSSRKLTLVR